MGNVLFQEAWSAYMGTDRPICRPYVGLKFNVKRRTIVIDKWGDCLAAVNLSDTHRRR